MILSDEARADLRDATAYYDAQQEGLGDEFVAKVDEVISRIDRMPELHAVVFRGVRRALVDRFPFAVYYRLDGDDVVVIAVVHSRRNPRSWQSRV